MLITLHQDMLSAPIIVLYHSRHHMFQLYILTCYQYSIATCRYRDTAVATVQTFKELSYILYCRLVLGVRGLSSANYPAHVLKLVQVKIQTRYKPRALSIDNLNIILNPNPHQRDHIWVSQLQSLTVA
jgi:hypothetical protein